MVWTRRQPRQLAIGIGAISYSIFLWNEPLLLGLRGWPGLVRQSPGDFVRDALVVLVFSILVGWLSHSLREGPTSQLGRVFQRDGRLQLPYADLNDDRREWETLLLFSSCSTRAQRSSHCFASGDPF
jgi:peptidoglycan/LPS O-acetylase OafA/YrhL